MDSTKKHVKTSPEEKANTLSKLFFWWFLPFYKNGYKNDVKFSDIYNSAKCDLSGPLGDKLEENWEKEIKKAEKLNRKPKLKTAIYNTFFKAYISSGFGLGFQWILLKLSLPVILGEYIAFFNKNIHTTDPLIGWGLAVGIIVASLVMVVFNHHTSLETQRIGMRIRIAVCSLIYRKLLRLNHISLGATAAGQLVNFLSNDVQRFDLAAQYLHFIWILPLFAVASIYILFRNVGIWATVVAMGFVSIQCVGQGVMSKYQGQLRYKIALRTDSRVKLMSEITSGIQVIKMYAWEKPFEKVVELYRKLEVNLVRKTSYLFGILSAMTVFTERVTLYLTIVTYILTGTGRAITGDVAFALAQLFNTVQAVFTYFFPRALTTYQEANVSVERIQEFLMLEESEPKQTTTGKNIQNPESLGEIKLLNVTASWNQKNIVPTLTNINLDLEPGTLCCVVGHVGSGKSSLLNVILKELSLASGNMSVNGKVSYACQEPWLFVSNVRQNILFGKEYNQRRYKDVVRVCSLERDFQQFPFGDKTLVGERGTSLSGGQRARVNLARAVYNEADIYLLDDPLSAVDTKVGRHLFDQCIVKYLRGKTRILVTHQMQFMKKADLIVIVNNGTIEVTGTFDELSLNYLSTLQQEGEEEVHKENTRKLSVDILEEKIIPRNPTFSNFQSNVSLAVSLMQDDEPQETDELVGKGDIPSSIYWGYFKSGNSYTYLGFTVFLFFIAQLITNASDLWLSNWTNVELRRQNSTSNLSTVLNSPSLNFTTEETATPTTLLNISAEPLLSEISTDLFGSTVSSITTVGYSIDDIVKNNFAEEGFKPKEYYMYVYTALIVVSVVLLIWRSFAFFNVCMSSSIVLHHKMFHNILQTPMRFFDTNPSGRILSRFSKDMGTIDELLPRCLMDSIIIFMVMIGILGMVFYISPWMMIPTAILAPIFYFSRTIYLASAQTIKRFEGTSRAPVFSHISASLYGISTIRASQAERMLIDEFDVLQDQHTSTWFLFVVCSESYGFYLDCLCTLFLALVTFQFMVMRNEDTLSGNVGLAISHTMIFTGMVQWGMRQTAEVASNMVSVERVAQYTTLEQEGPFESLPTKKPPREWPSRGRIVFKNTYLRYALELPPVLKNLNIEIESGEKVGVVGRTGAGKSTLIASLFRLAPIDGSITIDLIDTAEIGLNDLRLNISIIPQEPVLFSASVRYNLDPFETQSDDVLWKALENVELKDAITDLNQRVTEGGSNFSAGQRQLICLARAIVRNNKILVMDEATANVDPTTDAFIQKTIRERFKDCTVITIAHRLNTIMDSDRVIVMDAGQVMEFDHPYSLLQEHEGYFRKMVQETGQAMEEVLLKIAKDSYIKKNGTDQVVKKTQTE